MRQARNIPKLGTRRARARRAFHSIGEDSFYLGSVELSPPIYEFPVHCPPFVDRLAVDAELLDIFVGTDFTVCLRRSKVWRHDGSRAEGNAPVPTTRERERFRALSEPFRFFRAGKKARSHDRASRIGQDRGRERERSESLIGMGLRTRSGEGKVSLNNYAA